MEILNPYISPLSKGGKILNPASSSSGFCSVLSYTQTFALNSSGVFSGSQLTVTNDGGGAGQWFSQGDTTWINSSDLVSGEARFKSDTATTTETNLIFGQGATAICRLTFINATKVLYDAVGTVNVATGLTGGADYTWGIKFNQSNGTATWSDSEANSGSLTVDAGYNSASASTWSNGIITGISEVGVAEYNVGQEEFWLAASEGTYCEQ
jgi:hypothetical protein